MTPFGSQHRALSITVKKAERLLVVGFEDGARFELPAELLRVESPSAEVQGHSPSERKLVAGRREVGIIAVEPVGNYAVKLVFARLGRPHLPAQETGKGRLASPRNWAGASKCAASDNGIPHRSGACGQTARCLKGKLSRKGRKVPCAPLKLEARSLAPLEQRGPRPLWDQPVKCMGTRR